MQTSEEQEISKAQLRAFTARCSYAKGHVGVTFSRVDEPNVRPLTMEKP